MKRQHIFFWQNVIAQPIWVLRLAGWQGLGWGVGATPPALHASGQGSLEGSAYIWVLRLAAGWQGEGDGGVKAPTPVSLRLQALHASG